MMTIGASGQLQGGLSKADETRKRLHAAQERVAEPVAPSMAAGGDVMSAEEIAAFFGKQGAKKVCCPLIAAREHHTAPACKLETASSMRQDLPKR